MGGHIGLLLASIDNRIADVRDMPPHLTTKQPEWPTNLFSKLQTTAFGFSQQMMESMHQKSKINSYSMQFL